jgi:hypothetical protein
MPFRLTSPAIKRSEDDVIEQCLAFLKRRGYWCQRNPVGKWKNVFSNNIMTMGPVGIPDYIAVHGIYPAFFVEFKRPGKFLRATQQTQFQVIQFGFRLQAVMVDSLEELMRWLEGHEARADSRGHPSPERHPPSV